MKNTYLRYLCVMLFAFVGITAWGRTELRLGRVLTAAEINAGGREFILYLPYGANTPNDRYFQSDDNNNGLMSLNQNGNTTLPVLSERCVFMSVKVEGGIVLKHVASGKYIGGNSPTLVEDQANATVFTARNNCSPNFDSNFKNDPIPRERAVRLQKSDGNYLNSNGPGWAAGEGVWSAYIVFEAVRVEWPLQRGNVLTAEAINAGGKDVILWLPYKGSNPHDRYFQINADNDAFENLNVSDKNVLTTLSDCCVFEVETTEGGIVLKHKATGKYVGDTGDKPTPVEGKANAVVFTAQQVDSDNFDANFGNDTYLGSEAVRFLRNGTSNFMNSNGPQWFNGLGCWSAYIVCEATYAEPNVTLLDYIVTSTAANPVWYTIGSYNRGGYLRANYDNSLTHVAATYESKWWFERVDDHTGAIVAHNANGKVLSENWQMGDTPQHIFILENGVNKNGYCISTTNPMSGSSSLDANNNNTGVGSLTTSANDWQGTTWVFARTEAPSVSDYASELNDIRTVATDAVADANNGKVGYRDATALAEALAEYDAIVSPAFADFVSVQAAYDAYFTNFVMPQSGHVYRIANINANDNTLHYYLHYNASNTLTHSANVDDAELFMCRQVEGNTLDANQTGYVFVGLKSGRYLSWLGEGNKTGGNANDNYIASECALRLIVGYDSQCTQSNPTIFGTFHIIGRRDNSQGSAFIVKYENQQPTVWDKASTDNYYFKSDYSSLMLFEEVDYNNHKVTFNPAAEMPNIGYLSTFSFPIGITLPRGVKAYWAEPMGGGDNNYIHMTDVGEAVPANTGVVLVKEVETGEQTFSARMLPAAGERTTVSETNKLVGSGAQSLFISDASDAYILTRAYPTGSSDAIVGFFKLTDETEAGRTLSAYRAYLRVGDEYRTDTPTSSGVRQQVRIVWGDNDLATSITTVDTVNTVVNAYDLSGRRVAEPRGGIYIMNGQKVIIR